MSTIKIYFKPIIYFYVTLFSYLIIITSLNYFNIISYKSVSIISFIVTILLYMMIGFMEALVGNKKGYICGIIIGGINVLLFLLLSFILRVPIKINIILYLFILLISSTIGGMFGINYKSKN